MPTPDQYVKSELARLAWQEGHHASQNAMTAIAVVQANRIKAGVAGEDWLRIFDLQRRAWTGIRPSLRWLVYGNVPDVRDPAFQMILSTADAVYEGSDDPLTDGSLFYAQIGTADYDIGGWFQHAIVSQPEKHPRLATIGGFTFFGGKL